VYANPALRAYVDARAENRLGIYRMYGSGGELLYVGKSIRVRARLLSYFTAERGEKAGELVREAERVTWEYLPNEFAALVGEMKLIQRFRPRFNVEHKRRPHYAFIKVTRERAPRVIPVTRVADDGAEYYGPFPGVGELARLVLDLSHVLGLRDCPGATRVRFNDQLEIFPGRSPPLCMRADLGSCLAPCCGRSSAREYARAVATARSFLEGRARGPLRDVDEEMRRAAARTDFEYAGLLRDRAARLRHFRDRLMAFRGRVEDLSFVYPVPGHAGDDRVYLIRKGCIRRELPWPTNRRARSRVARIVEDVFSKADADPSALTPEEAAEILLVARWFRLRPRERRRVVPPRQWLEG